MVDWSGSEPFSGTTGMKDFQARTRLTSEAYEEGAKVLSTKMLLQWDQADQDRFLELVYLTTKLAGEAGEVAQCVGKFVRGDYQEMELYERLRKETQDVLWYVARIFDTLNLDMGSEAEELLLRLLDRQRRGKVKGSGDDR